MVEPKPSKYKVEFPLFFPTPICKLMSLGLFCKRELNLSGKGSIFIPLHPFK